jgi:hypothetical protein
MFLSFLFRGLSLPAHECRGFVNRSAIEVGVWRFVEGVNTEE